MKKINLIILLLVAVFYVNAQEPDSILAKANNFYVQGKYQDAANLYEKIIKSGYESSELYFNTANAYYKQNVIARAILNYEKALRLAPNDEDIRYNLDLTNRMVVDKIEVLPVFFITAWINSFKNIFSSDNWAIVSMLSFIISLIFISLYLYSRNFGLKKVSFWLGFIVLFISLFSFVFSYQQKQKLLVSNTAIIMSPSVTVKSSPDASGTDLFVIHEGTKVWLGDKISGWTEIKLSDGSKGWLKVDDLEVI
ncbi:MAG TPA: hypothetical protein DCG75_18150 [Bacteroidales bacterium]|nr:hypothetical protein [Bacteroidales bacterium]